MRAPLSLALLLVLQALAGCASPDPAPATGAAPAWSFTDTEGAVHSNATAFGEPAVLFFMASWCSSCKIMTQRLAAVHRDLAPQGLQMFTVSIERSDTPAILEDWKQRYAQPWPHGLDAEAMPRTFGIVAQSSVVVLDAQGRVVQSWGYPGASEAELRAALQRTFTE